MSAIPFMPLYVADYLADAAHLTTLEHGAYFRLIINYWQRGKPLDDDHDTLRGVAGLSEQEWAGMVKRIAKFFVIDGGYWNHKRIDAELIRMRTRPVLAVWNVLRLQAFNRDNFTCVYCGTRGGKLECDHIVPHSKGGASELYNLATACLPCNRSKADKNLKDWMGQ